MEVHFYQLQSSPLPRVVADLSARCLEQGWRVNVVAPAASGQLDDALWAFDDQSFLPHGTDKYDRAASQPVLISEEQVSANTPEALILTGLAPVEPASLDDYKRVSILFEGSDPGQLSLARQSWKAIVAAGAKAKYWSQETGKWEMKASSDAG
ncbi:MAG: DNA polymerase III subunit chi [Pseudomonadota bacterium]